MALAPADIIHRAPTIVGRVFLKSGRSGPLRGGNPWIFSGAIARTEPADLAPGDWVEVVDQSRTVGVGYYHPNTTIAVRMLALGDPLAPAEIIHRGLERAYALRRCLVPESTTCYRLVNGDGDSLSGIVIDRYGDALVVQLLTVGADRLRETIVTALEQQLAPRSILERSQGAVRRQEGLADRAGLLAGEALDEVLVSEHDIRLAVDLRHGQKTGYFLDQRENRMILRGLVHGRRVLDAYCYAGGFTLAALAGGAARVTAIDTSARALAAARRNLELNHCDRDRVELLQTDAAPFLAACEERFDLIVMDPPPLARSLKDAARAAHLYTELNALALRTLAPDGLLMTFSCSTHMGGEDFFHTVQRAQMKAGRHLRTLARLGPGPDHPVMLGHAEGDYLTGILLAACD